MLRFLSPRDEVSDEVWGHEEGRWRVEREKEGRVGAGL